MDERGWLEAIRAHPEDFRLPAYGEVWMTPERAAAYFARWEAAEVAGLPSPTLCPRCGVILRYCDSPFDQLHAWCRPKWWRAEGPLHAEDLP